MLENDFIKMNLMNYKFGAQTQTGVIEKNEKEKKNIEYGPFGELVSLVVKDSLTFCRIS